MLSYCHFTAYLIYRPYFLIKPTKTTKTYYVWTLYEGLLHEVFSKLALEHSFVLFNKKKHNQV